MVHLHDGLQVTFDHQRPDRRDRTSEGKRAVGLVVERHMELLVTDKDVHLEVLAYEIKLNGYRWCSYVAATLQIRCSIVAATLQQRFLLKYLAPVDCPA